MEHREFYSSLCSPLLAPVAPAGLKGAGWKLSVDAEIRSWWLRTQGRGGPYRTESNVVCRFCTMDVEFGVLSV